MHLPNIAEAAAEPIENAAGVQDGGDPSPAADAADRDDAGDDGEETEDENGEPGDGEDTGGGEPGKSEEPSAKIDRRIAKLTAARKDAESRAEKAEAELATLKGSAMSDAQAAAMAEKAGVLPELVSADEARRIAAWRNAKANDKYLSDWLEDNDGDAELEVGGKSYPRSEVRRMRRQWREQLDDMGDAPEKAMRRASDELRELLKLGREARKAGWKPGAQPQAKPAKPALKKPGATAPGEGHPARPAKQAAPKGDVDYSKMGSEDDLAAAIAAGNF